jgi:hypothetical protein
MFLLTVSRPWLQQAGVSPICKSQLLTLYYGLPHAFKLKKGFFMTPFYYKKNFPILNLHPHSAEEAHRTEEHRNEKCCNDAKAHPNNERKEHS